jgi:hypothetical protein
MTAQFVWMVNPFWHFPSRWTLVMPEVLENDQIDRAFTFDFELRVFDSKVRRRLEEIYTLLPRRYSQCLMSFCQSEKFFFQGSTHASCMENRGFKHPGKFFIVQKFFAKVVRIYSFQPMPQQSATISQATGTRNERTWKHFCCSCHPTFLGQEASQSSLIAR